MQDLYRTDNVVVRSIPASDTTRWVVTFDHYSIGHGFERSGFGEAFLQAVGLSAIHVMGVREDWYQYPEMPKAMEAVRKAVAGADRVLTYGSSMGGYAAIRFADAAGAHAVLAISPQYSIDPAKAPFEDRWLQDSRRIAWLPEIDGPISCSVRPVVVFDPTGNDGRHAARIAGDIAFQPLPLRHVAHPATTFLAEAGLLQPLLFETLSGEIDIADVRQRTRRLRKTSGVYVSTLAAAQPPHRPRLALALAERAVAVSPNNGIAMANLAKLLSRDGRHEDAIRLLEDLVALYSRDTTCLVHYADSLLAAGRYAEAVAIGREVLEALPHFAHLHSWAALQLWCADDYQGAIAAAERAVALAPGDDQYPRLLAAYRRETLVRDPQSSQGIAGRLTGWWRRVRGMGAGQSATAVKSAPIPDTDS